MKKTLFLILFASLSFLAMASPEDDAIYFVETLEVGNNFSQMALNLATQMQTTQIIFNEIGEDRASAVIKEQVVKTAQINQDEWNRNLALSYLEHFSGEELREVAERKTGSPLFREIALKQGSIGESMQKRSKDLLQKTAAEAMTNAFNISMPSNK